MRWMGRVIFIMLLIGLSVVQGQAQQQQIIGAEASATQLPGIDQSLLSQPTADVSCYDYILEYRGLVVDSQLKALLGITLSRTYANNSSVSVRFDDLRADAYPQCGSDMRIIVDVSVTINNCGCVNTSAATMIIGANLSIINNRNGTFEVRINPNPCSLGVASDWPVPLLIEQVIRDMANDIASKLSINMPLSGIASLAQARLETAPEVKIGTYQQGYMWVTQIYAPMIPGLGRPPEILNMGSVFTLVIGSRMFQELLGYQFAAGKFPTDMNDQGLFDQKGNIKITGLSASLQQGALNLTFTGRGPEGAPVAAVWNYGFGTALGGQLTPVMNNVIINGQAITLPSGPVINPVQDILTNVAIGIPGQSSILNTPSAPPSITTGVITPGSISVSGL